MADDHVITGIDTRLVLALYALGTQSFGSGRVAALPRPAVGFTLNGLRFFPPVVAEDLEKAHQFALQVNSRMLPPVGTPEPRFLWDEYEEVLDPTVVLLAERQPSPAEVDRHTAARAFLTPDVLATYNAGKQVVGIARLELGTIKANQPARDSPNFLIWQALLQAATDRLQAAEVDLLVRCEAAQVEAAIATVQSWSAAATAVSWSQHADAFELAKSGSLDGGEFLLTTFSPSDVVDGRGWSAFELRPDRIDDLVSSLGDLATGVGGADDRVLRVTVELTHVMINRSWFDPGVLRSNTWRFADPHRAPVSDGAEQAGGGAVAQGSFPYLVTGLVLARSLRVELAPASEGPLPLIELDYLDQIDFTDPALSIIATDPPEVAINPELPIDPRRQPNLDRQVRFRVAPLGNPAADVALIGATDRARAATFQPVAVTPAIRLGPQATILISPALLEAVQEADFLSPTAPRTSPPPSPTSRTLVGDGEVIVVAYLVEPTGAAPRPDSTLRWPTG